MRVLTVLILLAAGVVAVVLATTGPDPRVSPQDGTAAEASPQRGRQPPPPADPERTRVPGDTGDTQGEEPTPPPDHGADDAPDPDPAHPPAAVERTLLTLEVRDVRGRPVPEFTCSWELRGRPLKVLGEQGKASWSVPRDTPIDILVEAEGRQSERLLNVDLRAPELTLPVTLQPAVPEAGIEARVTFRGGPVPRVEVTVHPLDDDGRPRDVGPLWKRRARAADGVYDLPALPAGRYRLRIQAVDEDGALRPLLPHEEDLTVTGGEHLPVHADLEPGALLTLDVVDGDGGSRGEEVTIALEGPDGRRLATDWVGHADGERVVRAGGIPAPGAIHTARALPPGDYTLTFAFDGRQQRDTVTLPQGEHVRHRVVLP